MAIEDSAPFSTLAVNPIAVLLIPCATLKAPIAVLPSCCAKLFPPVAVLLFPPAVL
jgi:hypothetical protein